MRLACVVFSLSLFAADAFAQSGGANVGLSRVPLWPQDGDFLTGISRLVRHGLLDAGSPAVREALRELGGYLTYVDAAYADDAALIDVHGPPLVFRKLPGDGLEGEVLRAMKLSLSD